MGIATGECNSGYGFARHSKHIRAGLHGIAEHLRKSLWHIRALLARPAGLWLSVPDLAPRRDQPFSNYPVQSAHIRQVDRIGSARLVNRIGRCRPEAAQMRQVDWLGHLTALARLVHDDRPSRDQAKDSGRLAVMGIGSLAVSIAPFGTHADEGDGMAARIGRGCDAVSAEVPRVSRAMAKLLAATGAKMIARLAAGLLCITDHGTKTNRLAQ